MNDGSGHTGVKVTADELAVGNSIDLPCTVGEYAVITGISSCTVLNDRVIRRLRPRRQNDWLHENTVAYALMMRDNTDVTLDSVLVTTTSDEDFRSYFYVQGDVNSPYGLRVESTLVKPTKGNRVKLSGKIKSRADLGERYLGNVTLLDVLSTGNPLPQATEISNTALGGAALNRYTSGVYPEPSPPEDYPYNKGRLVRISGVVKYVYEDSSWKDSYYYIDDGSHLQDGTLHEMDVEPNIGVRVYTGDQSTMLSYDGQNYVYVPIRALPLPQVGDNVSVMGISGGFVSGGQPRRMLREVSSFGQWKSHFSVAEGSSPIGLAFDGQNLYYTYVGIPTPHMVYKTTITGTVLSQLPLPDGETQLGGLAWDSATNTLYAGSYTYDQGSSGPGHGTIFKYVGEQWETAFPTRKEARQAVGLDPLPMNCANCTGYIWQGGPNHNGMQWAEQSPGIIAGLASDQSGGLWFSNFAQSGTGRLAWHTDASGHLQTSDPKMPDGYVFAVDFDAPNGVGWDENYLYASEFYGVRVSTIKNEGKVHVIEPHGRNLPAVDSRARGWGRTVGYFVPSALINPPFLGTVYGVGVRDLECDPNSIWVATGGYKIGTTNMPGLIVRFSRDDSLQFISH